ncbi:MAG TPA: hypothetical protein VN954_09580 [Ktedonobacteraceae bacterium]|nr:hypothetical protein [Ktedonobacteraceae bacterium]
MKPISGIRKQRSLANHVISIVVNSLRISNRLRHYALFQSMLFCIILVLFTACDSSANTSSTNGAKQTLSISSGSTITYNTRPQDVLIRTFYGGGKLGTFEMSPEISIYGDGTYILGPGLQMQEGRLQAAALQQLLNKLVDTYGLLKLNKQQFYDIPGQNATVLQLMLNDKEYTYLYGPFGNMPESAQDRSEYQRLGNALTSITEALVGPTHPYTNQQMVLLVHQTYSPDLSQSIPNWSFQDFSLFQLSTFECGLIPPDLTGPNADTGCLTYTIPRTALLLNPQQLHHMKTLLHGQQQAVFLENGAYYSVTLRPLLPDEIEQKTLAMFGSQELSYTGVTLSKGPVPVPTPTITP